MLFHNQLNIVLFRYLTKIWYSLLFLLLCFEVPVLANTTDSISTKYRNGEFITYCQVWVKASDSISNAVANDFDYQMRYDLDGLFGWALKGLNLRKEKKDLMLFYFKSTSFKKETGVIRGIGDVIITDIITYPNIVVDSKLSKKKYTNGKSEFNIDLLYSNGFMKKMFATFTVLPKKDVGTWYIFENHVRFGWILDFFITQKRFETIMEWRLKRFVNNMKNEAERREKLGKKLTTNPYPDNYRGENFVSIE